MIADDPFDAEFKGISFYQLGPSVLRTLQLLPSRLGMFATNLDKVNTKFGDEHFVKDVLP